MWCQRSIKMQSSVDEFIGGDGNSWVAIIMYQGRAETHMGSLYRLSAPFNHRLGIGNGLSWNFTPQDLHRQFWFLWFHQFGGAMETGHRHHRRFTKALSFRWPADNRANPCDHHVVMQMSFSTTLDCLCSKLKTVSYKRKSTPEWHWLPLYLKLLTKFVWFARS